MAAQAPPPRIAGRYRATAPQVPGLSKRSGGDVRRLADLFGLSIQAGARYTNVISHPDLSGSRQP